MVHGSFISAHRHAYPTIEIVPSKIEVWTALEERWKKPAKLGVDIAMVRTLMVRTPRQGS